MTDEDGIWISDEDNEILQQAKAGAQGAIETETPPAAEGVAPVYLQGTVDAQLKALRNAGDTANYERVRGQVMKAALDRGDEPEFLRITEHHRPANQPQYVVSAEPEPTEEEVANLQAVFDNPAYRKEMEATDGDPQQVTRVYEKYNVPKDARLTFETPPPLYGGGAR